MARRKRRRRRPGACPCGSGRRYRECCKPYHRGEAVADTPVELMRSRYAAYAKGEVDYIVETTDPQGAAWSEDEQKWRAEIRQFGRDADFLGVDILDSSLEGDRGEVEFYAKLRAGGEDASFTERSQFVRREGRWLYSEGDVGG